MSLRTVLKFTCGVAACSAAAVYDPPDAGVALDAVEKALGDLVASPTLTKLQKGQAKKVVDDVEKVADELASPAGKKLSKEARAAKVSASIQELQNLQTTWSKASEKMIADHKAKMTSELAAKQAELVKDEKLLKVLNLQKALAEKKLSLEKLIEKKQNQASEKQAKDEAAKKEAIITDMLDLSKTLQAKNLPAEDKVKPVMAYLDGRVKDVDASLASMEAAKNAAEAKMSSLTTEKMQVQDQKDPLVKAQAVLKMLMKKQHRQFEKAKLPLTNELKELHQAINAINKGDAAALTAVGTKMQGEQKTQEAKSHKFLY